MPLQADSAPRPAILERGPLRMDAATRDVTWRGSPVRLTPSEWLALWALAERPRWVLSRDQLMDAICGADVAIDDRGIDSHIKRLRKKMRTVDAGFSAIETLYRFGYRFAPPAFPDQET